MMDKQDLIELLQYLLFIVKRAEVNQDKEDRQALSYNLKNLHNALQTEINILFDI